MLHVVAVYVYLLILPFDSSTYLYFLYCLCSCPRCPSFLWEGSFNGTQARTNPYLLLYLLASRVVHGIRHPFYYVTAVCILYLSMQVVQGFVTIPPRRIVPGTMHFSFLSFLYFCFLGYAPCKLVHSLNLFYI